MTTLVVHAWADRDPDTTPTGWRAQTVGPHPSLAGLFAFAATLHDVRSALAAVIYTAVQAGALGDGITADQINEIRLLVTTRKTFPTNALTTAS